MRCLPLLLLPALLVACTPANQTSMGRIGAGPPAYILNADILAANGARLGSATLSQEAEGTRVEASISGLSAGEYAIHLHAIGICEGPAFASAGGHFNPAMKAHGSMNPAGEHQGDLPNIVVGADGRGSISAVRPGLKLVGGDAPLLDADNAAIVLHAAPDDYRTDPAGNAGARIGCGVLARPQ